MCPACGPQHPFATSKTIQNVFERFRQDGWQNLVTGIGTSADKRTAGGLVLSVVSSMEARDLWRGNDLAARIIESAPRDALRRGFKLRIAGKDGRDNKDLSEAIMSALEELPGPIFVGKGLCANVIKARCFEKAYGGGAIFPWINDAAGNLTEPLNLENIPEIERLVVYEPRELRPSRFYPATDVRAGEPSHYQVVPIGGTATTQDGQPFVEIHESRLIIFPGIRVTREQLTGVEYGWGDNDLTRVRDVLNDFELTFGSAANILQDFAQAVLKLDGLADILGADGSGDASSRLSEMNRWRSVLRAIVLDKNDSFSRETVSLAGVPDMMDRFMFRLAAAARMPVSKLMGMAPAGLNATGESDGDNWDEEVANDQTHIKPMIERLIKLYMLSKNAATNGIEPDVWSIEFCPLSEPSAKEEAETRYIVGQTDWGYIDRGVYSADECGRARFGGDTYSADIAIDYDAHEAAIARATDAAQADPSQGTADPNAPTGAPADLPPAQTAFNGAQISSMIEVIKAGIAREIPVESARMILEIGFASITGDMARRLVPDNFTPPPAAPAPPFGGAPNPPPIPPKPPEPPVPEAA